MSPESLTIIAIVSIVATVLTAVVALATFFYRMFSGLKKDLKRDMRDMRSDLQSQINGVKEDLRHETGRIWKSIDNLSGKVDQLSSKVDQIIGVLGATMGSGRGKALVVEDSEASYKKDGDEGTTPAAKPKDGSPTGSKKSK